MYVHIVIGLLPKHIGANKGRKVVPWSIYRDDDGDVLECEDAKSFAPNLTVTKHLYNGIAQKTRVVYAIGRRVDRPLTAVITVI